MKKAIFFFFFFAWMDTNLLASQSIVLDTIIATLEDYQICAGECQELKPTITAIKGEPLYRWSTGETTPSITVCPLNYGNYRLTISDETGDSIELRSKVLVAKNNILPSLHVASPICEGDNIYMATDNLEWSGKAYWNGPNGYHEEGIQPSLVNANLTDRGIYSLVIVYYDKCVSDTNYFEIEIKDRSIDKPVCEQISMCNVVCDLDMHIIETDTLGRNPNENFNSSMCGQTINVDGVTTWFAFVAQPGEWDFIVRNETYSNDSTMSGWQMGIYKDCSFEEAIICTDSCTQDALHVPSSMFLPGETYYAFVRSCTFTPFKTEFGAQGQYDNKYCNDYIPMETVTDWNVSVDDFGGSGTYWETYLKDTIIADKTYRIIGNILARNLPYERFLREDKLERKVFMYRISDEKEYLLYDFSLEVGDSFLLPLENRKFQVFKIDSAIGTNGPLKRWNFQDGITRFSYMEMVGGNTLDYFFTDFISDPVIYTTSAFNQCELLYGTAYATRPPQFAEYDTIVADICNGQSFLGYSRTGNFTITTHNELGCDIFTKLYLTVHSTEDIVIDTTLCESESIHGFAESGSYEYDSLDVFGCVHRVYLSLTVLPLTDPNCIVSSKDESIIDVRVIPNPATNRLDVSLPPNLENQNAIIEVFDLSGRVICRSDFNGNITLNIDQWLNGIYFLRLSRNGYVLYNTKFIKG